MVFSTIIDCPKGGHLKDENTDDLDHVINDTEKLICIHVPESRFQVFFLLCSILFFSILFALKDICIQPLYIPHNRHTHF